MIVFKTYFKILNRNKASIFLTFFIFIGISIFFSSSNPNAVVENDLKSINVGMINNSNSKKNKGLEEYINQAMNVVTIENDKIKIKDALFYNTVDYVLVINENKLGSYTIPNSNSGFIVSNYVNSYLNTFASYKKANSNYSEAEIVSKTLKTLNNKTKVNKYSDNKNESKLSIMALYFNLYVYGVLSVIVSGIALIMIAFNNPSVLKRTMASKLSLRKRNTYIFVCHIINALGIWVLASLVSIILFKDIAFTPMHFMYLLNSLVFIFPVTAIAFVVGLLIRKYSTVSAVNNVIALGLSFISGAFVPQAILAPSVLKIASFSPTYWFVKNNDTIKGLTSFQIDKIAQPILIQIAFGIAFVALALAVSKQKNNYSTK